MFALPARTLALFAALSATSCQGDDVVVRVRDSVAEVYAAPLEDCAPSDTAVAFAVECELLHQITVVDVRRDGDRIGILGLLGGTQTGVLFLSEDRGRTFRQVSVFGDLIYQYAWDAHAIALVLGGGRAWLVLGTTELGALNAPAGRARWAEFDLSTGTLGSFDMNEFLLSAPLDVDEAGVASVFQVGGDPRGGLAYATVMRRDFVAGTSLPSFLGCESLECGATVWRSRNGGHEWQAFGVMGAIPALGYNGQVCRYLERWASGTSDYGEQLCVPYGSWGGGDSTGPDRFDAVFGADELLYAVSSHAERTSARTILADDLVSPARLGPELDLGPGTRIHGEGFNGRPRFGQLALVGRPNAAATTGTTFVRLAADGPVEVDVPPWPCDGPCGDVSMNLPPYGTIVWMMPLDGGEQLVVYVVDSEGPGLHQEKLFVDIVHETTSPVRLDAVLPGGSDTDEAATSPFPAYPHARKAEGLILACQEAELCGLMRRDECLTRYGSNTYTPGRSVDGTRDDLIAAASGGCDAISAALACAESWCPQYGLGCVTSANPDDSVTCDGEVTVDPSFCATRRVGTYCDGTRTVTCDGAGMARVTGDCGQGAACVAGASGVGEPTATCQLSGCTPTAACDGDVYTSCSNYTRCADRAQVCSPQGCVSEAVIPADAKCSWGGVYDRSFCVDDSVMFCLGDWLHYTSCTDLGFSGCVSSPAGAQCAP